MNRFFVNYVLIFVCVFPLGAGAQQTTPETAPGTQTPPQETEPAQSTAPLPRYEETIVVTATRTERPQKDVPVHTEVIDRRTIAATGARSVADALAQQLGIDVTPTVAGEGVQLQGIDARGVLILVDGQEVIGKVGGSIDIANLLIDDIERVEVVKGAASALYGSEALGGAINILTRGVTSPFAVSVEQRFESLGGRTTLASVGGRTGGWSGLLSGSRVTRNAYDLQPSEPSTTGSAYRKLGLNGKTGYRWGNATELSVVNRYYTEDASDVTVAGGVLSDDRVADDRWQTMAELRTSAGASSTLTVRGHLSRFRHLLDQVQRATGAGAPDLTRERLGEAEIQYDRAAGSHQLFSVGAELERVSMTSDRIGGGRRNATTAVGFLQDELVLHDRLRLLAGIRYDHNSDFGSAWSPKVAALFRASDLIRARASYGEGFKAPELKDLYYAFTHRAAGYRVVGNRDLQPETSRSLNASVEVDAWNRQLRFGVGAFRHRIDGLIDKKFVGRDPVSQLLTVTRANIGNVRTQGIESDVAWMPKVWATVGVGYGWLDGEDRRTGEPLPLRAHHTFKTRLFLQTPRTGTGVALFGRYVGRRAFADTNSDGRIDDFSPGFAVYDIQVTQPLGRQVRLFVGVANLTGSQDVRYFPSPGRRLYLGAAVRR